MKCYNPFSLEGKTILVTGASSGIGKVTAIECSKLGARLVITARNEERLSETFEELVGIGHVKVIMDLNDEEETKRFVTKLPALDGAVLCSGKGLTLPVQYASRDKMLDIFTTNFFAPIDLLRLMYKNKILQRNSSVILLSSCGGTMRFSGGNSIYGASKAAINSMMNYCANEFSARPVRVNSICPGMVETPFIHRGTISDKRMEENKKQYALGRYGNPLDIAHAAIYLLSNAASWVTGQSFYIEGGLKVKA